MSTQTAVSQLKINVLSQEQYDAAKTAGTLSDTELYMTPSSSSGGTSDYNNLNNQPQINGITLVGNKTSNDLGIDLSNYLPLSGGTLTGAVKLKDSTSTTDTDTGLNFGTQGHEFNLSGFNINEGSVNLSGAGIIHASSDSNDIFTFLGSNFKTVTILPEQGSLYADGTIQGLQVFGAVWNDYAEYRRADTVEPGRCVVENGDDSLSLSTGRMQPGAEIISDTFGFAIGETDGCKTPIAAAGRVLAYPFENREMFKPGVPVCSGPNGTVSIMTEEEARNNPWCIIGTVSSVPDYKEWGAGKVKVNGRIWIRIK